MGLTRKKTTYINITPIPSFIPRQLAIDMLHSHGEIIELNPLVLSFEAVKAPRDAPADEFYATWYEITERIQYIPGIGKLGSGIIKFKGCFHDMPWGLQTHTYAPANVDVRNKWQICGTQPGEPPETQELGIGAPAEGLYLREDIEIKCNMTMTSFVKKEMKAASKVLVDRMLKKAELLDSGAISAMMENGKLKTINPADRSSVAKLAASPDSPNQQPYKLPNSPMRSPAFPATQMYHPSKHTGEQGAVMELPGDFYHPQPSPNHLNPQDRRYSIASELSSNEQNAPDSRWSYQSASTRPSSYNSSGGMRSPGLEYNKEYLAELPTMNEAHEEHAERRELQEVPWPSKEQHQYRYNPQDFARMQQQYTQPPQYSAYDTRRPSGA
ncbi:uncharacterized protein CC84DRAFT_1173677 [Paraphaeosphaeria sporulosa]|uniref:DUF7053 domain-containing protein n=1 Tax=Paraphaeosphaeria sporulosa TaxID=1460663 RepID=A0A177CMG0_9PLEO|nr:uncharacterized protein CC84DRAFT_1173677 [Paraphaeosphaeria sporulosa]OAG08132.1 hypothetical protein CC84DRAFT_1173677 [Paraphaeosphaeria sporulosa]